MVFGSLRDLLSTGRHLLTVSFVTSLKSNLCTALTTRNITGNECINSHAQNTTVLLTHVFWTGIPWYRSRIRGGPLSPAQTTTKFNCKLLRQNLYLGCESRASLIEGAILLFLRDAMLLGCDTLPFDEFHSPYVSWSPSDIWDAPSGGLEYYCLCS